MAEQQHITVKISPNGSITAETHGIHGPKCLDYIAVLEDLLDAATTSSAFTADYQTTNQDTANAAAHEVSHELRQQ